MPPTDTWTIPGEEMSQRAGNDSKADKSRKNECEEHRRQLEALDN